MLHKKIAIPITTLVLLLTSFLNASANDTCLVRQRCEVAYGPTAINGDSDDLDCAVVRKIGNTSITHIAVYEVRGERHVIRGKTWLAVSAMSGSCEDLRADAVRRLQSAQASCLRVMAAMEDSYAPCRN